MDQIEEEVAVFLKKHFHLNDLGVPRYYLGIEIRRNNEGFYCIKQEKYIRKILCRFDLQDAKISSVPLNQGYEKYRNDG